jgi:DNA-binding CsgD family transcriptional regulator
MRVSGKSPRTADSLAAQRYLLEALGHPLLLGQIDGTEVHRTSALVRCLHPRSAAARARLEGALRALHCELARLGLEGWSTSTDHRPAVRRRHVEADRCRFRLRGVHLEGARLGWAVDGILIELELLGRRLPPPEALRARFRLSAREAEVAHLLASGLKDGDIAARLGISRRTAEHHTTHLLRKLGLSSRTAVAAFLIAAAE